MHFGGGMEGCFGRSGSVWQAQAGSRFFLTLLERTMLNSTTFSRDVIFTRSAEQQLRVICLTNAGNPLVDECLSLLFAQQSLWISLSPEHFKCKHVKQQQVSPCVLFLCSWKHYRNLLHKISKWFLTRNYHCNNWNLQITQSEMEWDSKSVTIHS